MANKIPKISKQSKERLTKQLANARKRIKRAMDKAGRSYHGPDIKDFYLSTALEKLASGMHINTLYAMARNATAEKIADAASKWQKQQPVAYMYGGGGVTKAEYSKLTKAAAKANKMLTSALKKYPYLEGILPDGYYPSDLLQKVTTKKALREMTDALNKAYTKENMQLIPINENGEAGLKAEIEFLNFFISGENKKRQEAAKAQKIDYENHGVLLLQNEFDTRPINWQTAANMDHLRKIAEATTDSKDMDRADNWLINYMGTLDALEEYLRSERNIDPKILKKLDEIYEIIGRINDPSMIRHITKYSEAIAIAYNYFDDTEEVDEQLTAIELAWLSFEAEYM